MKNLENILRECLQHDKKSQHLLFNNFKDLYMGIAIRYMKNRELAKDVVQLSFIKIFENLDTLKKLATFESWSRRIVINTALNELKKSSKYEETPFSEESVEFKELFDVEISEILKIDNKQLIELINTLPEGYRTVFNLYMIDGFSHKEIAITLGISENTSRSQLSKAKKNLMAKIDKLSRGDYGKAFG